MGMLDGRIALVTGSGAGIGAGVARRLAAEGATVMIGDLDPGASSSVVAEIEAAGGKAAPHQLDVSDRASVDACVAATAELPGANGAIHILVNNAGVIRPAMFKKMEEAQFRTVMDVHLGGTFNCSQAVLPHMPDDGTGRIIKVTSAAGLTGTVGQANYGAAKAAIVGLTKSLAKEYAHKGICVNALAPLAATAMTETVRTDERFAKATLERIPMKRWAEPDEIAGVFAFFASDSASYITGQVLPVDGGLVM